MPHLYIRSKFTEFLSFIFLIPFVLILHQEKYFSFAIDNPICHTYLTIKKKVLDQKRPSLKYLVYLVLEVTTFTTPISSNM